MEKSTTTMPKRRRNSFFFYVTTFSGTYELHIGYKTTKGKIVPFSRSKDGAPVKIPFGPPKSCEYLSDVERDTGEKVSKYRFRNERNELHSIKASLLNNLELADDDFARLVTTLSTGDGSKLLLAYYVTLTNFSEGFVHHQECHDATGFIADEKEGWREKLVQAGGSVEDLINFISLAKKCALKVIDTEQALELLRSSKKSAAVKRKQSTMPVNEKDTVQRPSKLSMVEKLKFREEEELKDRNGLEVAFQESLCGVAHISIDNISIPPQFIKSVSSKARIEFIKSSIRKRYNPALSVLVVCPVDAKKKINIEKDKFYVIQKVKCFQAFKELDENGEFAKLYDHQHRNILCYILNSNNPELMQHGNLSENLVNGQFSGKVVPHDILNNFFALTRVPNVDAVKVVQRMCNLCCFRSEESTALERICRDWSCDGHKILQKTLEAFEGYKTLDVTKNVCGLAGKISRGEKNKLTNVMLRNLGKCTEEFFVLNHEKVLNKDWSLKLLLENSLKLIEIDKVYLVLMKIASFTPVEAIQIMHPGKFESEQMQPFIGAVFNDKGKNQKAIELEKYYKFVITSPIEDVYHEPVIFQKYDGLDEMVNVEEINSADILIYHIKKLKLELISKYVHSLIKSNKSLQVGVLLFSCEIDYSCVRSLLRTEIDHASSGETVEVYPLMFGNSSSSVIGSKVIENVTYGVIFGKFSVIKSPLLSLYNDLSQLIYVVDSVCPPGCNVLMLADPEVTLFKVHDENLSWYTKYIGSHQAIEKFQRDLAKDKLPVCSDISNSDDGEEDVSNSDDGVEDVSFEDNCTNENTPSFSREETILECSGGQYGDECVASTSSTPSKTPLKVPVYNVLASVKPRKRVLFHDQGILPDIK